MFNNIPAKKT